MITDAQTIAGHVAAVEHVAIGWRYVLAGETSPEVDSVVIAHEGGTVQIRYRDGTVVSVDADSRHTVHRVRPKGEQA